MTRYRFRLRDDLPRGFRENNKYPELPAIVAFLKPNENKEFDDPEVFQKVLNQFPGYLSKHRIPEGPDTALRSGLFLRQTEIESVFNVLTGSEENFSGTCWFGSLGPDDKIIQYFAAEREARRKSLMEDDD